MKFRFSLKRAIIDILYIKDQVYQVFKNEERYRVLLDFLMEKDYLSDENYPFPTYKEIELQTGIKTYEIRKRLTELYDKIFDYNTGLNLDFRQVEIYFTLEYFKNYASFQCKELTYIPRVGDNIEVPFLKAKINTDYFYVQDVRHCFEGYKQIINIRLKSGSFNSYWYFRKHEAIEKKELGFNDFYDLNDYRLKDKLIFGK